MYVRFRALSLAFVQLLFFSESKNVTSNETQQQTATTATTAGITSTKASYIVNSCRTNNH